MNTYRVTFDRIGRNRDVAPLVTEAEDADDLADRIYRYGRRHLASRDVEVTVDLGQLRGGFLCGFNNGGTFTIEALP